MLKNVKAGGIRCDEILWIENKARVWGQSPRRCGNFTAFLKNKAFFKHSLV